MKRNLHIHTPAVYGFGRIFGINAMRKSQDGLEDKGDIEKLRESDKESCRQKEKDKLERRQGKCDVEELQTATEKQKKVKNRLMPQANFFFFFFGKEN